MPNGNGKRYGLGAMECWLEDVLSQIHDHACLAAVNLVRHSRYHLALKRQSLYCGSMHGANQVLYGLLHGGAS